MVYTEGHPRDYDNSIYHTFYRGGELHRSDGRRSRATADNIRPLVPRWGGDNTPVLWLRGKLNTYTDYDLDVVGLIRRR